LVLTADVPAHKMSIKADSKLVPPGSIKRLECQARQTQGDRARPTVGVVVPRPRPRLR
jgi:hypothetical protein